MRNGISPTITTIFTCYTIIMLYIVDGSFPAGQLPGFLVQAVHIVLWRIPCDRIIRHGPVRPVTRLPALGFTAGYTKHVGDTLTDVTDPVRPVYETQPPRRPLVSHLGAVHRSGRKLQKRPIRCHHQHLVRKDLNPAIQRRVPPRAEDSAGIHIRVSVAGHHHRQDPVNMDIGGGINHGPCCHIHRLQAWVFTLISPG